MVLWMNNNISTDESIPSIIISIFILYGLIEFFFYYLYALKRISFTLFLVFSVVFFVIYIPRFMLINKLKNKDEVKVTDFSLLINNREIYFDHITDFRVIEGKRHVLFFFNNKMIVYKSTTFYLRLKNGEINFEVIGEKKAQLLMTLLNNLLEE